LSEMFGLENRLSIKRRTAGWLGSSFARLLCITTYFGALSIFKREGDPSRRISDRAFNSPWSAADSHDEFELGPSLITSYNNHTVRVYMSYCSQLETRARA